MPFTFFFHFGNGREGKKTHSYKPGLEEGDTNLNMDDDCPVTMPLRLKDDSVNRYY